MVVPPLGYAPGGARPALAILRFGAYEKGAGAGAQSLSLSKPAQSALMR